MFFKLLVLINLNLMIIKNGNACIPMKPDDDGFYLSTTPTPCRTPLNAAELFIGTGVVLVERPPFSQAAPIGTCINSVNGVNTYYNGETTENYLNGGPVWAGEWIRGTGCPSPCVCTATACYVPMPGNPSIFPSIAFYPHCNTPDQCFIALVFGSGGGSIVNPQNSADMYSANGQSFNVNDPSFPKVTSVGCNGCPVTT